MIAAQYGVTDAGARLLRILANPMNRTMKMVDKCGLADISQDTYYRLFGKDERFQGAYRELCQSVILSQAINAVHGLTTAAALGDVSASKAVLEMTGFYSPSAKVEHSVAHDLGPTLRDLITRRNKKMKGGIE